MTHEEFETLLMRRCELIKATLRLKGEEYSSDAERLHNFKIAAQLSQTTPMRALWGMLVKHLVSVFDLIHLNFKPTRFLIDEKIGDCINYFILLEALAVEKMEQKDE